MPDHGKQAIQAIWSVETGATLSTGLGVQERFPGRGLSFELVQSVYFVRLLTVSEGNKGRV